MRVAKLFGLLYLCFLDVLSVNVIELGVHHADLAVDQIHGADLFVFAALTLVLFQDLLLDLVKDSVCRFIGGSFRLLGFGTAVEGVRGWGAPPTVT